jgi:hypothetical protein
VLLVLKADIHTLCLHRFVSTKKRSMCTSKRFPVPVRTQTQTS